MTSQATKPNRRCTVVSFRFRSTKLEKSFGRSKRRKDLKGLVGTPLELLERSWNNLDHLYHLVSTCIACFKHLGSRDTLNVMQDMQASISVSKKRTTSEAV